MRRFVLSLAVLGAAALVACSGGGSVLSFNNGGGNSDRVIVTVAGPTNIARVLPGAGVAISAVGVRGSQNGTTVNNRFRWSAALVTGGTYVFNSAGQTRPCQQLSFQPFPFPAAAPPPTPAPIPYAADFGVYIAIDPTNESNIIFFPPIVVPNPGPAVPPAPATPPPGAGTLTPRFPYCVVVSATNRDTGAVGSITVAVVDPQNPEG
jgi:hypothetical protein